MFATPDQFLALHKANLASLQALTASSFEGMERLAQLNIAAARSTIDEATDKVKALLDAKDAKAVADLGVNAMQPVGEKLTAYAKHVYDIASDTSAEFVKVVDQQMADSNRQLHTVIDSMARNAPAGTEGMVSFVKQAVSSASTAFDQFNRASRQVVEMAEANMTAAGKSVSKAAANGKRAA
jgi:phasin family protein